jgi:hypothetical protein
MANPCGGLSNTPQSKATCQLGYYTGLLFSEEKLAAITESNAALIATWQTLLKADMPSRLVNIRFDRNEPGEYGVREVENDDGSKDIVSVTYGTDKHMVKSGLGSMKTWLADFAGGRNGYVYRYTDKGNIVGKEVTAETIEQVEVNITATVMKATKDQPEYLVLNVQDLENWNAFKNAVKPTWDPKALSSVENMTFSVGTCDQTHTVITVKDFDKIAVSGLSTTGAGHFTVTRASDGGTVTVTSITRSGGVYTLNYASQTIADVLTFGYAEPSTSGEYYDLTATVTGTVAAS